MVIKNFIRIFVVLSVMDFSLRSINFADDIIVPWRKTIMTRKQREQVLQSINKQFCSLFERFQDEEGYESHEEYKEAVRNILKTKDCELRYFAVNRAAMHVVYLLDGIECCADYELTETNITLKYWEREAKPVSKA
jgi:hypothetical protein